MDTVVGILHLFKESKPVATKPNRKNNNFEGLKAMIHDSKSKAFSLLGSARHAQMRRFRRSVLYS